MVFEVIMNLKSGDLVTYEVTYSDLCGGLFEKPQGFIYSKSARSCRTGAVSMFVSVLFVRYIDSRQILLSTGLQHSFHILSRCFDDSSDWFQMF